MKLIIDGFKTKEQIHRFIEWYSDDGEDSLYEFIMINGDVNEADDYCAEVEDYPMFDCDNTPKETKDSVAITLMEAPSEN
jgi:hypothetical protein